MQTDIKDIVVIGGGLMGSSTAWHLSNQGENVMLIEQQDSVYTFGSSFGEARIARSLGPENDIFSYLHNLSVSETERLIRILNEKEGADKHQMEDIYTTSPVTYIYYESWRNTVETLIENQRDPFEYAASAEEASQEFGMSVPDSALVLREFKEHSGTMNPKELIKKLHTGIEYQGNEIRYNYKVIGLRKKDDLYEIELTNTKTQETQTILSKKVVSAAGPYTGKLLKDIAPEFDELITPKRVFLVFLKIDPATYQSLSSDQKQKIREFYPVADFTSDLMFSMVEKVDSDGVPIIKIGGHLIRKEIQNLDQVWQKELTEGEKSWGIRTTLNYLQQLNIPVRQDDLQFLDGYSCVYSLTKSEVPFVTNILDDEYQPDPNFIVLGGMSGVGAKGTMTYGLIGANLLHEQGEKSVMYQKTKKALGVNRLLNQFGQNRTSSDKSAGEMTSWFIPE
jgi:glycine/D-amino acid oxidase-like deaminating enzyme